MPRVLKCAALMVCASLFVSNLSQAQDLGGAPSFTITDVRLQGLQRVSAGTVFNLIPVGVGDRIDELAVRSLTRQLFESGYFKDIRIARDDGVLIVTLAERPAIESIELEGNKAIKTDALLSGLSDQGLREGEIFKQATLELLFALVHAQMKGLLTSGRARSILRPLRRFDDHLDLQR